MASAAPGGVASRFWGPFWGLFSFFKEKYLFIIII
jgi:hypothetical protein